MNLHGNCVFVVWDNEEKPRLLFGPFSLFLWILSRKDINSETERKPLPIVREQIQVQ